jgi:hypothetical protein
MSAKRKNHAGAQSKAVSARKGLTKEILTHFTAGALKRQ